MIDYDQFFKDAVPQALAGLSPDKSPKWGSMNAEEMLQHLRLGIKMSKENQQGKVSTPEAKLPAYKGFLMSNKNFGKNLDRPPYFEQKLDSLEFGALKNQLLQELEQLLQFFKENPDHTSVHDSFGILNAAEWTHLHYKHFKHHLTQFGLIDE